MYTNLPAHDKASSTNKFMTSYNRYSTYMHWLGIQLSHPETTQTQSVSLRHYRRHDDCKP